MNNSMKMNSDSGLQREAVGSMVLIVALAIIIVVPIEAWYLREIVGSVVLLFVPWWRITRAAFVGDKEIDGLERVALSFALSIAVVPLLVFYANLLGFAISVRLVLLVVLAVVLASMGRLAWRTRHG